MKHPLFKVFMADTVPEVVGRILKSGYIGQGEYVEEFERVFRHYINADRDIITVNSATSALDLAMHMCGVDHESEVITTAITCTATNSPAINRGATLIWADVDENTGLIDENSIAGLITSRTKCIIAVNWGGRKPDYNKLKAYGLPVIEDAAHGPYKLDGNNGDYVIWSFQAIKFLTSGDGGAILCPDPERARLLRWFGLDRRSSSDFRAAQNIKEVGYKYHMNDINAAIALENLNHLSNAGTIIARY
jgi:dTDP-4-amino-4,6-dideoxygalactose transaminase